MIVIVVMCHIRPYPWTTSVGREGCHWTKELYNLQCSNPGSAELGYLYFCLSKQWSIFCSLGLALEVEPTNFSCTVYTCTPYIFIHTLACELMYALSYNCISVTFLLRAPKRCLKNGVHSCVHLISQWLMHSCAWVNFYQPFYRLICTKEDLGMKITKLMHHHMP